MATRPTNGGNALRLSRRDLLKAGLAAGVSSVHLAAASSLATLGGRRGAPKRRRTSCTSVGNSDPAYFESIISGRRLPMAHDALRFVYSTLVRHKVGPGIQPGNFIVEHLM